jgi:hypothetical protein
MDLWSADPMTFVDPVLAELGTGRVGPDGLSDVADGRAVPQVAVVADGQVSRGNRKPC